MGPQIIIYINSYRRPEMLRKLLEELRTYFCPIFDTLNLRYAVCVNLQGSNIAAAQADWLQELNTNTWHWSQLVILENDSDPATAHVPIGWTTREGLRAAAATLNPDGNPEALPASTRLVMLMDDDSTFSPDLLTNNNICELVTHFIGNHLYALSCKLGPERATTLKTQPFLSKLAPFMPHKEKMLWVHPTILFEAINLEGFDKLSSGEDVVIAATAWLKDFNACRSVYGLGSFFHLTYEAHLAGSEPPPVSYLDVTSGWGPFNIYPDIFVEPGQLGSDYFAVYQSAIERVQHGRLASTGQDLGWPGR